ncbi:hypothetical protein VP01_637g7 [Puccinia sorghi]|uniref:Uncharacterized protein n=1 Tax=Puccinia sorghi TaxID=27349 RepID=A0A0L6UFY3_9BASI|nr:hypothetical protein VP01_637g7 [Puccinia sorghi]
MPHNTDHLHKVIFPLPMYTSKLFKCRLVPHIPQGARWKNGLVPVPPEAAKTLVTSFYLCGAELMRVSQIWLTEELGNLVQGIEPPIPVFSIQNVWDLFSSILSLIKAYD